MVIRPHRLAAPVLLPQPTVWCERFACLRGGNMNGSHCARFWGTGFLVAWLCGGLTVGLAQQPNISNSTTSKQPARDDDLPRPRRQPVDKEREERLRQEVEARLPQMPPTILPAEANAI